MSLLPQSKGSKLMELSKTDNRSAFAQTIKRRDGAMRDMLGMGLDPVGHAEDEPRIAKLWELSAQTMAVEIMLVSLIDGLVRAPAGSRIFVASVLQDAVNTARIMAERGPTQTEGDVHFSRIIGIIRMTAETLGVADSLPP